jgi:hypothetical protein
MDSGFRIDVLEEGKKIKLSFVGEGRSNSSATFGIEALGSLVATLLKAANSAGIAMAQAGGPVSGGLAADWFPVRPSTTALGSSPEPNCEALVLGFGPTALAISLQRTSLRALGEGMIALSAGGEAQ